MINFQVISGGNNREAAGRAADYPEEKREKHTARDGSEYQTGYFSENGGAPSQWLGAGAQAQGLDGRVAREDLIDGYLGRAKDASGKVVQETGARGGKKETDDRRYAMDLALSAPKTVSLLALIGGDERLLQAHNLANSVAMAWAEKNMVFARIGKGGESSEFTGNATIASYMHETARTVGGIADPQLHTHNLLMNLTQRADGTWVGARLDFGKNNEKFKVLDSIYKAELARLVRAAGYEIEFTKDGFEIKGISREQIEAFSARKKQIDDALEEHGLTRDTASAQQRDNANLATRGKKSQLSDIDQKYEWRERAREEGLDLQSMQEKSRETAEKQQAQSPDQDRQPITGADAVKSAIHHLSERDTLFTETSLLDESLKAGLGEVSYADVQKAISERAGGLVAAGKVDRGEGKTEPLFTTKASIFREAEILHRARDGQGKAEAIIPALANADGLQNQSVTPDVSFTKEEIEDGKQRYRDAASSGTIDGEIGGAQEIEPLTQHRMRNLSERSLDADTQRENSGVLPGNEGTDGRGSDDLRRTNDDPRIAQVISDFEQKKGFTLGDGQKAAVALALTSTDQHIGIVGAAGAGKTTSMELIVEQYKAAGYEVIGVAPSAAAAHELKSAGCDDTRTLASALMMRQKEEDVGKKKIYIMDESGMVSAKDMDAFLKKADSEGARTILVGDPLQLSAVEAGSPYAQMLETDSIAYARIDEIQRQKDPQLRELAQAFARGDAATGVELAKPYMRQVQATDADYAEAALKKDEAQATGAGSDAKATEKMMQFAEAHDYKGSDSFEDVRKFLDEKAYYVGLGAGAAEQQGPKAPSEVRKIALARAAAEAYLALSPEERQQTLMLAATNDTRRLINEKVRDGMKAEGSLGADGMTISALDKLDITRERATRAAHYTAKDPGDAVIVQFNRELKDPDGNIIAEKGSQWRVVDNTGGKLSLQDFKNPEKTIQIDPAKARLNAYVERKMELATGDQVMFRQNDKERGVLNGTEGKVVGIDKEAGVVFIKTDQGMIAIDANKAESLDYAYARTVHSSQGATVDRTILVGEASRQAMAELAYVGCSREKLALMIITDDIDRLMKAWSKFAEQHFAMDAARAKPPESYEELQKARAEADREAGKSGDFAQKRAEQQEQRAQAAPGASASFTAEQAATPDFFEQQFAAEKEKKEQEQPSAGGDGGLEKDEEEPKMHEREREREREYELTR